VECKTELLKQEHIRKLKNNRMEYAGIARFFRMQVANLFSEIAQALSEDFIARKNRVYEHVYTRMLRMSA
jgi:hypothetical protein